MEIIANITEDAEGRKKIKLKKNDLPIAFKRTRIWSNYSMQKAGDENL